MARELRIGIPLIEDSIGDLRSYYKAYRPRGWLFEGLRKGHYSLISVEKIMEHAIKKAGIQKKAPVHTLRHSFATHLMHKDLARIHNPLDILLRRKS